MDTVDLLDDIHWWQVFLTADVGEREDIMILWLWYCMFGTQPHLQQDPNRYGSNNTNTDYRTYNQLQQLHYNNLQLYVERWEEMAHDGSVLYQIMA